ncbi:MAG: CRTAC1 family protein [Acidobacteria bacterium]|nr:CRTAC1 family protein [Acidobacteriota bacterium]
MLARRIGPRIAFLAAAAPLVLGAAAGAPAPAITFKDIARESGITFVHTMAKSGVKYMIETMGAGGGFIDYDRDGDLDIVLVNGAPVPGYQGPKDLSSALYRNDGEGHFTDVTATSGAVNRGYGMGVCAGDYDNDGYQDLYFPNFGPDVLLHNDGDGRFSEATKLSGTGSPAWGSSCAFFDADGDGDLDLFVTNYVDFSFENNKFCGDYTHNVRTYCHPNVYNSQPDVLYRNEGDGTFTDASREMGIKDTYGNGLGVVVADYDNDGDPDVYVANDKTPNTLWRNDGTGHFTDVSLLAGVGYGLEGAPHAGMGTDFGDIDGDGDLDLIVTNLDFENNTLYRNEGGGIFSDASFPSGIGAVSLSFVGFGSRFVDYDNDSLPDLVIANGHILDNAPYFNDSTTYAERNFVHHNLGGGKFEEVGLRLGPDMAIPNVGRGLASGDIDLDGDVDLLVTVCGGRPRLFRNDGGNAKRSLLVRLAGTVSNRDALGARVTVTAGGRTQIDEVRSGASYQSQSDTRLEFGLGEGAEAEKLEIRWPDGRVDRFEHVAAGRVTLIEGESELQR